MTTERFKKLFAEKARATKQVKHVGGAYLQALEHVSGSSALTRVADFNFVTFWTENISGIPFSQQLNMYNKVIDGKEGWRYERRFETLQSLVSRGVFILKNIGQQGLQDMLNELYPSE